MDFIYDADGESMKVCQQVLLFTDSENPTFNNIFHLI